MTDRGRLVYALLRTLLAWTPSLQSRTGLDRAPRGFVNGARFVTCPDCLTNDRVLASCETCRGSGEIPDSGPDPYDSGVAKGIIRGKVSLSHRAAGEDDSKRAARERDAELRRLDFQLHHPQERKDEIATPDTLTRAVELRDQLYRHGSYAELEVALQRLREERPSAYHLAMQVAYQPFGEAPIEPVAAAVEAVCEVLARWMDGPVRVPEFVTISTDAELERIAREGKGALWHGKSDWHRLKRSERGALILAMADAGISATAIGLRVGLKRRRVQEILAEQRALRDARADGSAA